MQSRDLLEVLDDRYKTASTVVTTQVPVNAWHERIADPTAEAILDRLVHRAYHPGLKSESRRKTGSPLTHAVQPGGMVFTPASLRADSWTPCRKHWTA